MEYYKYWYKIGFGSKYSIWCADYDSQNSIPDHIYKDGEYLPYFKSITDLEEFAKRKNITLVNEEPILHNLDIIRVWLTKPNKKINCNHFLAAWNIFGDYAASYDNYHRKFEKMTKEHLREYDKLFYGNNLKPMRKLGAKYTPTWSKE